MWIGNGVAIVTRNPASDCPVSNFEVDDDDDDDDNIEQVLSEHEQIFFYGQTDAARRLLLEQAKWAELQVDSNWRYPLHQFHLPFLKRANMEVPHDTPNSILILQTDALKAGKANVVKVLETVRRLFRQRDFDEQGICSLVAAVSNNNIVDVVVEAILWLHDVKCRPVFPSLIERAILTQNLPLFKLSLQRKWPMNAKATAAASRVGDIRLLDALLKHGCPIDSESVVTAREQGRLDVLRFLTHKVRLPDVTLQAPTGNGGTSTARGATIHGYLFMHLAADPELSQFIDQYLHFYDSKSDQQ